MNRRQTMFPSSRTSMSFWTRKIGCFKSLCIVLWFIYPLVRCQSSINLMPSDFESLTKNPSLFVDKTMLLETLFWGPTEGKIYSITTPPGFGRTTNLQMIKSFAAISTDNLGVRLDPFNTSSARLFSLDARPVLQVSRHEHVIRDHLAQYPVVYLDLSNVTNPSLRQTMLNLHRRVKQSYGDFDWLEGRQLSKTRQSTFDILEHDKRRKQWRYTNKLLTKQPNAVDIQTSISKLINVLVEEFNRKVILLIDNYDSPIMDAVYQRSNTSVDQFYEFFNVFFSTTLDDTVNQTKMVLLVGTHPLSIKIRTEINYFNFLEEHDFSPFFGYTETELEHLLAFNPKSLPIHKLRIYFGGFQANGSSTSLYNPKSATDYFNLISARDSNTSLKLPSLYDARLHRLVKKFMPNLTLQQEQSDRGWLSGRGFKISQRLEIDQLERISGIVNGYANVTDRDIDTFVSILVAQGYFTLVVGNMTRDAMAIPNYQMTTTLQKYMS